MKGLLHEKAFSRGDMGEVRKQFPKIVFLLVFVICSFFPFKSFSDTAYLIGTVTLEGAAYTATTTYVYLNCQGSGWSYASDYAQVGSDGTYSLSGEDSYNPCSSSYPDMSSYSCQVYAYQWSDNTIANTEYYDVDLTCGSTLTQNLALQRKDKTINLTLTSGNTPITAGMSGYCSQTTSPWTYSYSTEIDSSGIISVPVIAGTYTCSAYCDWTHWYNLGETCPYSGYPQATVTIGADESSESASLNFSQKDKQIKVFVYAGSNAVTDGIQVSCSQQESPWTYSSVTSVSDDNSYTCPVTAGYYYISSYCSTWPCQYDGYPNTYVTVGANDSSVEAELTYEVKDKTIRTTILAGTDQITNNVTAYCYKNGGDWASTSDSSANSSGIYELQVGAGTHECYAYCTDWQNCEISGYPRATVTVDQVDTTVDLTLTFFKNNSTLSGVVSNGPNSYVSIQADQLESSSALSTSVSGGVRYATVKGGSAEKSQIYRSVTTNSVGAFVTTMPPGTYKITAYPPYGTAYAQATTTVTTIADSTTTVSLTFPEKTASITGRLTDANGNGVKGSLSAWTSYGSTSANDWAWTETDADGNYTLAVLENVKYNISAWPYTWNNSSSICTESNEGMQTVTASSTAQTVNFSYPFCDCTMTVNAVDGNGNILSQISASVDATPTDFDSSEHYYGIWGQINAGTGTINIEADREYKFNMWAWDSDYVAGEEVTATCTGGSGSVNISFADVIDGAIRGNFVDSDGNSVTLNSNSYISVYATKGSTYRNCTTTVTGYTCDLSEGAWSFGYWIDPTSGYASAPAGTTSSDITITSSGGVTQDLTLLSTGYIDVIVLDHDQITPKQNVWVEASPYSISEGENDYQYRYCSGGCSTDANGYCRISVGADNIGVSYFVNVYMPYTMKLEESLSNPKEQEAVVTIGQTTSITLSYAQPDQTILVSVVEGSDVSASLSKALTKDTEVPIPLKQILNATDNASGPEVGATVDCFSDFGGSFQVTTDTDGNAQCPCVSGETWYVVTYNKVANALYLSEVTEASCDSATTVQVAIDNVATLPEGRTVTTEDVGTQTTSVELADGFSVSFPPGSLGSAGEQATVNVDTTVTPFTANKRPASFYAYSVNALDSNNAAITQLNVAATFKVPINTTQVSNLGLSLASVQASYFSESKGVYAEVSNAVTTEDDGNSQSFISFQQTHLTDFAVIGNGFLTGIQGETGEEIGIGDGDDAGDDAGSAASSGGGCGCNFRRPASLSAGISTVILSFICLGIVLVFRQRQKRDY